MSDHVCQECGCQCSSCVDKSSLNLHLHREIELLHYRTGLQTQHIHQMEASMMVSEPKNGEVAYLRDELQALQSKYDRLIESHRKIQKVNQNLEEKVLKIVDQCETEKSTLNNEVTILSGKLLDAKVTLCDLEDENERLRNDCSLAVQLLQCKPSNFVSQKLESLPSDLKHRIRSHMTHDQLRQYEHRARRWATVA
ncbi:PREDICTED: tight junction-associated protein 1-like, partial [Priapulus caudatus]|uniref:Tight junction-associated protein 1-like n=1 Tax=Priapulus caudatus TaxID=37621 RepID=A0ABM1ETX8_PRICU